MEREYAALMIDLKGSKDIPVEMRREIQIYWNKIVNVLNRIFRQDMYFKVNFSGGDQVQGLFYRPEAAYLYYRLFSMCTHPFQTHGGIGIGTCDIQLGSKKHTGGQDGIAYYRARAASDLADADIGYPILLNSGEENLGRDRVINSLIGMAALIALRHTAHQNQIMLITELLYPISDAYIQTEQDETLEKQYELLRLKHKFDLKFAERKGNLLPIEHLMRNDEAVFYDVNIRKAAKTKNPANYVTEGKGRGIPKTLEEVLGIKYQSINTTLKAADIFNIRNLSIAALEEMRRI